MGRVKDELFDESSVEDINEPFIDTDEEETDGKGNLMQTAAPLTIGGEKYEVFAKEEIECPECGKMWGFDCVITESGVVSVIEGEHDCKLAGRTKWV